MRNLGLSGTQTDIFLAVMLQSTRGLKFIDKRDLYLFSGIHCEIKQGVHSQGKSKRKNIFSRSGICQEILTSVRKFCIYIRQKSGIFEETGKRYQE